MSDDVRASLSVGLRKAGGELCRLLGSYLPEIGGGDWWTTHVTTQLSYGQQGQVRARGIDRLGGLDLAALLRVFERNWSTISSCPPQHGFV